MLASRQKAQLEYKANYAINKVFFFFFFLQLPVSFS